MERMMTTREKVARALFNRQLAFEREHSQRVVHPAWEVAYRDYWGLLADAALAAACPVCDGEREVVVDSFQAGDQTAEEWGPCPACSATPESENTDV